MTARNYRELFVWQVSEQFKAEVRQLIAQSSSRIDQCVPANRLLKRCFKGMLRLKQSQHRYLAQQRRDRLRGT